MKLLGVIPARGGSVGVPRKNVRLLEGKPLIAHTIIAALKSTSLDRVVVTTDDAEIAEIARHWGAEVPFLRPSELAQNDTPTLPVLQHVVNWLAENEDYYPDAVMTLQPTSPLRGSRSIDGAAALFEKDGSADSLVSCVAVPHAYHPRSVMRLGADGYLETYLEAPTLTGRQNKEPLFARNGPAICITRRECLTDYIFGGRLICFLMDEASSIDIDDLDDLAAVERLLEDREANDEQ